MKHDPAAWQGFVSAVHSSHPQQPAPSQEHGLESPPPPYTSSPRLQPAATAKMSDISPNKTSSSDNMSSSSSGDDGSAAGEAPLLSQQWQPKPRSPPATRATREAYAREPAMSATCTSPDPWTKYDDSPGCCFSSTGGCCFSRRGGCCFSDTEGCCFSRTKGCCFSSNGGCCFSNNGGGCCC
ncbi:hypothetical protein diail_3554 [Diaporthe ilicicola]|nr:hypothetical protein diail_3554 [Diaporthe ilicicola]